jgi:hypothetical protein
MEQRALGNVARDNVRAILAAFERRLQSIDAQLAFRFFNIGGRPWHLKHDFSKIGLMSPSNVTPFFAAAGAVCSNPLCPPRSTRTCR